MRRSLVSIVLFIAFISSAIAQDTNSTAGTTGSPSVTDPLTTEAASTPTVQAPAAQSSTLSQSAAPAQSTPPSGASVTSSREKPDALKIYRNGFQLDNVGRTADAKAAYEQAIGVCKQDLIENPKNMDAYTVYSWALFRLGRYREGTEICTEALKIASDFRVVETLGECYFYLANYKESLKYMEKYIDAAPRGDRISTAYFFVGEIYRLTKLYNRAEIAYTAAVYLEPGISLWWYRLGAMRETVGDKSAAATAYERALKLKPTYKEATDGFNRVRT
jgi:tetratricopeptide (TPR) repeat protein